MSLEIFKPALIITITLGAMYLAAGAMVNKVAEGVGKINQKKEIER